MKKKLSGLILFLFFSLPFLSCENSKPYKIGISQCSTDDWRNKMNEEMLHEMMLHEDAEIEIRSANDNSRQQIEDIKYFIDNAFDIIIVAPNESKALTPVIKEAFEKKIPVIIFDRDIEGPYYTQRIGVDNYGLGKEAANYVSKLFPEGDINILEIYGLSGSSPAEQRHKGFIENLPQKAKILASGNGNWRLEEAIQVTDSILNVNPKINLVFAHNDRMAIGASEVTKNKNRDDIRIIGIDAAPSIGLKAVADSVIDATFLYPTQGHIIIKEALKILQGEPYEKEITLPLSSPVNLTNADLLQIQNADLDDEKIKITVLKDRLDDYWKKQTAERGLLYAIIAISILLFGILFLVLKMYWSNKKHQEALLIKNRQLEEERDKQKELNEKLEEATRSKLSFFTNVSHDLRTPLTLISEPVAQLENAPNLDNRQRNLLKIADKNVRILKRLINQILDFRKFENDKLTLNLTEINFTATLKEWLGSFESMARKRDIELRLLEPSDKDELHLAVDIEKLERVIFNLLANAFKYSPDKSLITVSYELKNEKLIIKVADTGEGISEEDQKRIFDRFYQVDNIRPKGSGIGLSLAKAFVELHGGSLAVVSELKRGSEFTIELPVRHVSENVEQTEANITGKDVEAELGDIEGEVDFSDNKPLLLVIDDNKDIRELVTELMKDDYNILTAANGKEGIRKAVKYVPDIIICDIMMPGIDGLEVCTRLKSEVATSHIPVLMLTACSLDEQKVQGFESGADGYMAKPFSTEVLKAQTGALINNRRKIKDLYNSTSGVFKNEKKQEGNKDKKETIVKKDFESDFYDRFLSVFEPEMSNADLSVETLASRLGLERTQFYRKIKAITNYSPVELMRVLRLRKARTLLTATDKNISEIGYEVGFSNPAYFTKCYREMFGETPSETKAKLQ